MITDHLTTMPKLAQGVKALSHHTTAFSNTQAAWRFVNNEHAATPIGTSRTISINRKLWPLYARLVSCPLSQS